ncbi:MAG: hypothetical protein H0U64_03295 [Gemmatimonadaceae bacterium]|nr:hypothetical protein [Gemmatimonadaceae bacterium]
MLAIIRMRRLMIPAILAGILISAPSSGAQNMGMKMDKKMSNMSMGQMEKMMKSWPKASKEAAMYMTKKYGKPMHMNEHMAMWGKTGQWKRTVVYNYEMNHQFPGPHTDVMQQWIDYRTPLDKYDDLAMYDGSIVVERTNGEISARCDKEAANYLAVNLAYEIATGKRSVDDARKMYGDQIMLMKAGKPAPYTERLIFNPPMGGTADADHPHM